MKTVSILVSGKVQGVYYRQSTKEKAAALGITGQVNNQADGSVHIIATGTEGQLNRLIDWCKKGPPLAHVTSVTVTDIPFTGFTAFSIQKSS